MTPVRAALRDAAARFAFSATARLDAELLLAHALGIPRDRLLLALDDHSVPPAFADLVERRARHEPVAYLTGTRAFWTIDVRVGPGALVPRADSETLLEAAVAHFAGAVGPARILDLGTGPGTLLLAALDQWPAATGLGVDASAAALRWARCNAEALGMRERVRFEEGDWASDVAGPFDLVLANPPYIARDEVLPDEVARYEPAGALFAGEDGLDDYRRIAGQLPRLLDKGAVACVEIGARQGSSVAALFRAQRLSVTVRRDLGDRDRCLVVTA
ncbi:protein-(glutamine-N5) methyltransferase, release factor-specific [Sphingomonas sp. Leaf231]|uniref:peptide chain release factor N(5)-glutamine methyltransferase n=1 Tax=Sphingomonas sp. Leaf231 TaxID=1736301 RepID=UPI0006F3FC25|nr:peptide chain release factor N(5)-glutamine methyltransferase [Sphingomonas sp. Leaf231]KQN92331.1 protein-(glutamine-N5) methyltransferase, release factor-specific [Sphingomonas sp. Leaf231]